jgi:hypothetical protein
MITRKLFIEKQPDDVTCGPTCLHGVYRFYQDELPLQQVIHDVEMLEEGGTFAANLAQHALKRGYTATIYSFNILVFDPTWFDLAKDKLISKLEAQIKVKNDNKVRQASEAYISFLREGGELRFVDLTKKLILDLLSDNIPVIVGLSATYLYKKAREVVTTNQCNDIEGEPSGHFVVLAGVDEHGLVTINDPYRPNPISKDGLFSIDVEHLICSILLGVVTCDANILVLRKNRA